ncbi:MAG: hypothetical protein AAFY50_16980 [Cyanobacteria bacterium J06648_1]
MVVEVHNFIYEKVRLIQVETLEHHFNGVTGEIQDILDNTDCEWEDIYSAYFECEKDGTVTYFENESIESGNPGIWTYIIYDCPAGEEEIVSNVNVDSHTQALLLQHQYDKNQRIVIFFARISFILYQFMYRLIPIISWLF